MFSFNRKIYKSQLAKLFGYDANLAEEILLLGSNGSSTKRHWKAAARKMKRKWVIIGNGTPYLSLKLHSAK